jgi:hypothetical protein
LAACSAAVVAFAWAARWVRVLAEALPRAARCVAVVLRVVRRRVLLLRRRVVVVLLLLLLVDILVPPPEAVCSESY